MEIRDMPNNEVCTTADNFFLIQCPAPTSSSNGDSSHSEHPLLNSLVVKLIVEHLNPTFEQLKKIRLISKTWTDATHHRWRKSTAVLTLIPDPTLFTPTDYSNGLPVSQFLENYNNPQSPFQLASKPFLNYKFKGHTFDIQFCNKDDGPAKAFWNTIGPLIESLYFEDCTFLDHISSNLVTCPMTQLLVECIPNVKHLSLNVVAVQGTNRSIDPRAIQVFLSKPHVNLQTLTVFGGLDGNIDLKYLLEMSPSLESITGIDQRRFNDMDVQNLLPPVYEARFKANSDMSPVPLSNLKHLDLINSSYLLDSEDYWYWGIPPKINKAGNVMQLPLETLALQLEADIFNLGFGNPDVTLNRYFASFSATLKTLKAYRVPVGPPYSTFLSGSFGEMTKLVEVHLYGTIAPHFGFLKSTPNLKRLSIDLACFGKREHLMEWLRKHNTVKYQKHLGDMAKEVSSDLQEVILCPGLEYLEIDFEFPEESLRLLGKWLPNLKLLRTILNGKTVPVVCDVWKDLTELVCLHGSSIGDNCIIRKDKAGFSKRPPEKMKICYLNDLKRFQLDTYCGLSELTDDAVFQGFLKMTALKYIQICVGEDMSSEAENALRKGIEFCEVFRTNKLKDDDLCGCDRCVFYHEAKRGFRGLDFGSIPGSEEDEDSFGRFDIGLW